MKKKKESGSTAHEEKKKVGRPTQYTKELAEEICMRISHGELLRHICTEERMPTESTVRNWAFDNLDGFSEPYARAREIGWHIIGEEIIDISDDSSMDLAERKDGETVTNHENIQRARLRVDSRKWLLSKMLPKIYGDSTTLKGDKDNPLPPSVLVTNQVLDVLTLEQLEKVREVALGNQGE